MSRGAIFWGLVLIVLGSLFLLDNLGIIAVNVWQVIGPVFLILFGIWVLLGPVMGSAKVEKAVIPINDASSARVEINYGAGRLKIGSGAGIINLLEGEFGGGVEKHIHQQGGRLEGRLSLPMQNWPFMWQPGHFDWNVRFNNQIPLLMVLNVGAAESILDFGDLIVNELVLKTGASSTEITLPAHAGISKCSISAGAAGVNVRVPQGVAVRINASVGLGAINVDQSRFPRSNGEYRSADFDVAPNKIDIIVETGLGAVDIR